LDRTGRAQQLLRRNNPVLAPWGSAVFLLAR